jgi:hypothetical protein
LKPAMTASDSKNQPKNQRRKRLENKSRLWSDKTNWVDQF